MSSTVPRTLVVGDRPQTSARAVVVGLAMAVFAISLRFVAPRLLLGPALLSLAAVAGFLLAAGVGWFRGGVLAGILVATLPVFALDAASTALFEPVSLELALRAARGAAWFSIGVSVLVAGPLGYAIGAALRSDDESLRSFRSSWNLHIIDEQRAVLLVWGCLAAAAVVAWTVLPVSVMPSSIAASPIFVVGGLLVSIFLGYRARGALAPAIAGGIGTSAGLRLFTLGFTTMVGGARAMQPLTSVGLILLVGFVVGIPLGLTGYVIGRTLVT